jgi:hypothetical protein
MVPEASRKRQVAMPNSLYRTVVGRAKLRKLLDVNHEGGRCRSNFVGLIITFFSHHISRQIHQAQHVKRKDIQDTEA